MKMILQNVPQQTVISWYHIVKVSIVIIFSCPTIRHATSVAFFRVERVMITLDFIFLVNSSMTINGTN